jgi:hypothetical protein
MVEYHCRWDSRDRTVVVVPLAGKGADNRWPEQTGRPSSWVSPTIR